MSCTVSCSMCVEGLVSREVVFCWGCFAGAFEFVGIGRLAVNALVSTKVSGSLINLHRKKPFRQRSSRQPLATLRKGRKTDAF